MSLVPQPDPVPFLTETQLWLCGRWGEKGYAVISEGKHHAKVVVPPALFDLLAILILAATKPIPPESSWVPSGFITAEELYRELARRGGDDLQHPWFTTKYVTRAIYRLRELLAAALFSKGKGGRQWIHRFIESGPLGYRLSSPAANLRLAILHGLGEVETGERKPWPEGESRGPNEDPTGIEPRSKTW